MTRVLLEGVSKVYAGDVRAGPVRAVSNVNLEIHDGELLVLIGPSGCGKTTLLRLIAGLEKPTTGNIRFDGVEVSGVAPRHRQVAMVFQEDALQPHLTVRENIAFGLKLRRRTAWLGGWLAQPPANNKDDKQPVPRHLTNGEITDRINKAAAALGIEQLLDRLPRQLSGGERQRAALGQAMVRSPKVTLLDEPLASLDAPVRGQLRVELRQLQRRQRVTSVYVTHDQVEAMTMGDRIAVMFDGKLQQVGAPCEVYDRPANRKVAGLLGSPPMNFVDGRIERRSAKPGNGSGTALWFVGGGLRVELSPAQTARFGGTRAIEQPVTLGLRPEQIDVSLSAEGPGAVESLANITMVETLGDSTILHLRVENIAEDTTTLRSKNTLRSKIPRRWTGETEVKFTFDPDDCIFFDAESGALIDKPATTKQPNGR